MTKAQRQAAQSSSAIQRSLTGIKSALTGLAGAVSVGLFVGMARDALQFAGSLGELAQKTGTTVEQYQILTRAALANGASQEQLDAALIRLNKTLGDAQRGSESATRALHGLGITGDQIKNLERGGDLLPLVMDGVKNLGSASEQASRAQEVMGRGAAALLPILAQGAAGYNAMAEEAKRAGLITAEQASKADEAADSIDLLAYSFKTNLAVAVADNVDQVSALIGMLSDLITAASSASRFMQGLADSADRVIQTRMATQGLTAGIRAKGRRLLVEGETRRVDAFFADFNRGRDIMGNPIRPVAGSGGGNVRQDLARPSRGGGGGKSAEQLAREAERARAEAERERVEALRNAHQFDSDLRRGQIDELRARQDLTEDYLARSVIARQILELEQEQERKALELAVATGELEQAQATQIVQQNAIIGQLENQRIDLDIQQGQRDALQEQEQRRFDIARRQLEGEADLAETAAERRAIELRILELAYREERERLERLTTEGRTFEEQQGAREQLAALNDRQALDKASVMRGTMGPMESFLRSLPDTAAKANEAFEAVAANGISDIIDGLAEANFSVKDLGRTFANVAKQIIADLIRIQLQRAVVGALSNILGGIGGGGILQKAQGKPSVGIPKLAGGGAGILGGNGGLDTNLLSLNGKPVAWVSRGERLSVSPDAGSNGSIAHIIPSPYFDVVVDGRVLSHAPSIASAGARGGVSLLAQSSRRRLA